MTGEWVRRVAAQRDYAVDWRFVSLRLLNAHVDYAAHFPPEYEAGHTAGLRLLRVASRVRDEYGPGAVARFYEASGSRIFETDGGADAARDTRALAEAVLADAGLPVDLADALDDADR